MKKLSRAYAKTNQGYELTRLHRKLAARPTGADCRQMPKRIAFLLYNQPWRWKRLCGPPPVSGVKRVTARSQPFRIRDQQIKAANVPTEERAEVHKRHAALPDICKAWVEFELTRPFQGFVRATVFEQYDCQPASAAARKRDSSAPPVCKTRPYGRTDQRYIHLHDKGARFSLNFYFSTPPEVCRKPHMSHKTYKMGCFCLGIDKAKLTLTAVEDPFLFQDELKRPRRPTAPGLTRATPGAALQEIKLGIKSCDAYLRLFQCYLAKLPAAARGPAAAAFLKMLQTWQKSIAAAGANVGSRAAIGKGCTMAVDAFRKAMANNPTAKDCLRP